MKTFFISLLLFAFASCKNIPEQIVVPKQQYDSLWMENSVLKQTIENKDSSTIYLKSYDVAVTAENKKLKDSIFIINYKIEKVRLYLNICLKKPSQEKFLKGWIRRAIN